MALVPAPTDQRAANLAWWEGVAGVHRRASSGYYDPSPVLRGDSSLGAPEEQALAWAAPHGVAGLDILHLQCHLGLDALTFIRRGARVTGVDFSPTALQGAADLADRCGLTLELVRADAIALPAELSGRFDLVWATIGVLTWHADLKPWMRSAAMALRPGGRLVIVDLHPLYCMPDTLTPLSVDFPYGFDGPRAYDESGTYSDSEAALPTTVSVSYAHSIGETVNAAISAGLRIEKLDELLEADFDPRGNLLTREADGRYRWRLGTGPASAPSPPLPVLFSLIARREG